MKRTGFLHRSTHLRRTRPSGKHRDPDCLADFASEHTTCWRCGTGGFEFKEGVWNRLIIHHISRKRRWDVRENLARLCDRCHRVYHDGDSQEKFELCDVLFLKLVHDPEWFDVGKLCELLCVKCIELRPSERNVA